MVFKEKCTMIFYLCLSGTLNLQFPMDGILGEIRLFAPDFAPSGWAFCHGQLLPINQNMALFSILGTSYGGNGINNFALPDFRGRTPVGFGSGANLSTYTIGQKTGNPTNTLAIPQLPAHTHTVSGTMSLKATAGAANLESPVGNYFANDGTAKFDVQHDGVTMPYNALLNNTGGNTAFNNIMPYQALHYVICLTGTYPYP
jgi:microcystin-dependent protein